MDLTEREKEVLSWFLEQNWEAFTKVAEEVLGNGGLHRLAEKLDLNVRC